MCLSNRSSRTSPSTGSPCRIRGLDFTIECADSAWIVIVDRQLLASAVSNLLKNAFTFSRPGGQVVLRAHAEHGRLQIEVSDACGGIAESDGDPFEAFKRPRGRYQMGSGLGLSIARKAVRADGGDIHIRNTPGTGCVFLVDLPLATEDEPVLMTSR